MNIEELIDGSNSTRSLLRSDETMLVTELEHLYQGMADLEKQVAQLTEEKGEAETELKSAIKQNDLLAQKLQHTIREKNSLEQALNANATISTAVEETGAPRQEETKRCFVGRLKAAWKGARKGWEEY